IVARNTGSSFEVTLWHSGTLKTSDGWFPNISSPRVSVADVTGDGRADIMGVNFWGDIFLETATASNTYEVSWSAHTLLPIEATGLYNTGATRLFYSDVTGEGI